MKRKIRSNVMMLLCVSMFMTSCEKDHDHDDHNHNHDEEELITTVKLKIAIPGQEKTFSFIDIDGPGGNAPVVDTIVISSSNNPYGVSVDFLNESINPVDTVTSEILEEATDHEVYYTPSSGLNLNVEKIDTDTLGRKLGLKSAWLTTAPSSGTLKVTLMHKPGQKGANDPISVGETDVEVEFPVIIN